MGRKLLAFLLSELAIVRIICKMCNGVTELPIAELPKRFSGGECRCPICQKPIMVQLSPTTSANPLAALAMIATKVKESHAQCDVEFILPDNG
jgi:hypothetical protein